MGYDELEWYCATNDGDISALRERLAAPETKVATLNGKPKKELILPNINEAKLKPRQSPRIQIYSTYRVFNTTELLENILLNLPIGDLLKSQSVSKLFRATVQGSIEIKRALFLAPTNTDLLSGGFVYNHLLSSYFTDLDFNFRGLLFAVHYPDHYKCNRESAEVYITNFDNSSLRGQFKSRRNKAKQDGSWKDMYLTSPVRKIEMQFEDCKPEIMEATTLGGILENIYKRWRHDDDEDQGEDEDDVDENERRSE